MAHVDSSADAAALQRIFVSLGLAGEGEAVTARPLAGGVSSAIWRVDLRSRSYCVKQALPKLKVAKDWRVPVDRVFSEIAYLEVVGAIAPGRVPRLVGQDEASKSFVMEFLGDDYRNWKDDLLAGHVAVDVAAAVGELVGTIHAATANDAQIARRFATDANFHALRLEPYLVEAARVHPQVWLQLMNIVDRTASTKRVLVHGDVSPKNILVGPAGPVLLDAECAWFGDPAFDVAFCANHFLLKAAHMPQHAGELLAALDAFVGAYAPHVRWEAWQELQPRIASLLPALALARIDGKSPVEYLGEQQRERVRRAALALLDAAPGTVEEIASHWKRTFDA